MEGSSYSFQDMLKLMNSLTAFETLLDSADLNPDVCIQLGVHEQFKQLLGKVSKCVKHDDIPDVKAKCVCGLCDEEIKIVSFDIRTSLAIHYASEVHRSIVKNKELKQEDEQNKPKANEDRVPLAFNLNYIPEVLKKSSSDISTSSQNEHKRIINNLNNASAACSKCQSMLGLCTCAFQEKPLIDLGEKLTNLNIQLQPGPHHPVLSAKSEPPKFEQQLPPRGRQPMPQNRSNKKPQENKYRSRSHAEPGTQQSINIHVHMPPSDKPAAAKPVAAKPVAAKPVAAKPVAKGSQKSHLEENLEKLRTRQLGPREETQLMFRMIREAEGKSWRRENITRDGNEYMCNVCNTGVFINTPYDVVMHTRGKFHSKNLCSDSCQNNSPHNKTQTMSHKQKGHTGVQQGRDAVGYLNDHNMELLRKHLLEENKELSLMWKMVKEAEGGRWGRHHFTTHDPGTFSCDLCNMDLNSPHQLVQHVQGQSHINKLVEDNCSIT